MTPKMRWSILLSLLAGAAALVAWSDPPGSAGEVVVAVVSENPRGRTAATNAEAAPPDDSGTMILALKARNAGSSTGDAFSSHDWTPPPPPPPPAPPPPRPSAPPLPFSYIGKELEGSRWTVFLADRNSSRIVRQGDLIDNIYRVDSVAPPTLTLTYLPLKQQQTIAIGSAHDQ